MNYDTALIGKWHLGLESPNTPNERGFDFFHNDYWDHKRHGINYMRLNDKIIEVKGHATDLFTDWSIEYIKSKKNSNKPFFLYLAYNAPPHLLLRKGNEKRERYDNKFSCFYSIKGNKSV